MSVQLTCPKCGFSSSIPDAFAGKQGKCPKCRQVIQAPPLDSSNSSQPRTGKSTAALNAARPAAPEPAAQETEEYSWLNDTSSSAAARPARNTGSSTSRGKSAARTSKTKAKSNSPVSKSTLLMVGGGVLVLVIGSVVYFMSGGFSGQTAKNNKDGASTKSTSKEKGGKDSKSSAASADGETKRPAHGAKLSEIFAYVKPGIVKIVIYDGGRELGLGSGFVIDKSGLVVTNYHVMAPANSAVATFTDGSQQDIEGYFAVEPRWDLAIVKLKSLPTYARVLELNGGQPEQAADVMAVGSPHNHAFVPTNGIVGRAVRTWELPKEAQNFVSKLGGPNEQLWIEHNAKISPGNSGGPLFNADGEVIGVNSWVDGSVGFGYAISASYITELKLRALPRIAPVTEYHKDMDHEVAGLMPQHPGEGDPNAIEVTIDVLQRLFDENNAKHWQPADVADYARMQQLARLIVSAKNGSKKEVSDRSSELTKQLGAMKWDPETQIKSVNAQAVAGLERPFTGAFIFAAMQQKISSGNRDAVIMQVVGSDQQLVLLGGSDMPAYSAGAQCLVIGVVSGRTRSPDGKPAAVLQDAIVLPLAPKS